jgi:hypothetical protein
MRHSSTVIPAVSQNIPAGTAKSFSPMMRKK